MRQATTTIRLAPTSLDGFIGQKKGRENLSVFIDAARGRKEALDHVCLPARRGLAKPRWRRLSRVSWGPAFARLPVRSFQKPVIWHRF